MAAGVTTRLWEFDDLVSLWEAYERGEALAAWARGDTDGLPGRKPPPRPAQQMQTPRERFPTLFDIPDGGVWLGNLQAALDAVTAEDDVAEIGGLSSVTDTLRDAPDPIKKKVTDMLAAAMTRITVAKELADEPADP